METVALICAVLCALAFTVSAQTDETCNGRTVTCFVDPCSVATCPGIANAQCIPNFCNKCSAKFVVRGIAVPEQDCAGNSRSQTSGQDRTNAAASPLSGSRGLFGRSRSNTGERRNRLGSGGSPLLGLLFGGSRPSGSSGSQRGLIDTPPVLRDLVNRVSQWQPMDTNARGKMENFIGGLLSKVFGSLG